MRLTAAEFAARFPGAAVSNAHRPSTPGAVVPLPVKAAPRTMEERVLESVESDNQQEVVKWWEDH